MSTKRRKVRKSRKRSCKNGKLKKPIRTKKGGKRRCKKRKTKRKTKRKYKMFQPKGLAQLASRNFADNLTGGIDQRIEQVRTLNIPYNTKIDIINKIDKDKNLISQFYVAKVSRDINENNIFIRYIKSNKNNRVKTVLKYYPEYANATKKYNGETALIEATNKGNTEIVEMLLKAGANVNAKKKGKGNTALIEASYRGNIEIVRMLLNAGADANLQNQLGITALMYASIEGNTEIVKMLLNADADANHHTIGISTEYETSLMYASQQGHTEIVELLRQYGATE